MILPFLFVLTSLAVYIYRRYSMYHQIPLIDISDADFLRLPTQKIHTVRGLVHLAGVLTQVGSWAFIFAWRLESAILEHQQNPSQVGSPLYQIICPALSMLPWVSSSTILVDKWANCGRRRGSFVRPGLKIWYNVNDRLSFLVCRSTCS